MRFTQKRILFLAFSIFASIAIRQSHAAPPSSSFVPGTGTQLKQCGDDFEDPNWTFHFNGPKSSEEIDKQQRLPLGRSANDRWFEGAKRGYPDVVERVPTPPDGLIGSEGSLLLQSKLTGIPGKISREMQQDDFIGNVQYRIGGPISTHQAPSFTTRVFMPPIEEWENRVGPQFAFRSAIETTKMEKGKFIFSPSKEENEIYWPGLFVLMEYRKNAEGKSERHAYFRIRANQNGGDVRGPDIPVMGWWTLGLSFSSDGMVHYYARQGVGDLTREDHIASSFPYGYRCERVRAFFYNTINKEDGKTWSTPFIIDDPKVFIMHSGRTARR